MSTLSDRDADLLYLNSRSFIAAYYDMRRELRETGRIPLNDLNLLVMGAYYADVITVGKAAEILGVSILEFREKYGKFLDEFEGSYND